MKYILFIIAIASSTLPILGQSGTFAGNYERKVKTEKGEVIEYVLSLNPDGTFLFHFYRHLGPSQPKENAYGKGRWKAEKKLIYFYADEHDDVDTEYQLNFNASKARSNRRSPRHKSPKKLKESIRFYSSDIFWIKGLELFKVNN